MKTLSRRYSNTILFLLGFFSFVTSFAQNVTLSGSVKNADGQPLAGASVQLQGNTGGVVTDNNGNYSLQAAPGKHILVISYVGHATQRTEVTVSGNTTQDITLLSVGDLNEVTVTGSRNPARTRTETPVPVDVIPVSTVINDIGQVDLNQILTFIAPSFQSARQTISDGTDHVDPAQLPSSLISIFQELHFEQWVEFLAYIHHQGLACTAAQIFSLQ